MRSALLLMLAAVSGACEAADPIAAPADTGTVYAVDSVAPDSSSETEPKDDGTDATDATPACSSLETVTPLPVDPTCKPKSGDYRPGATDDGFAMCISDDNSYHPFNTSISSIARVTAFDDIAAKLRFGSDAVPTPADFLDARTIFTADQGLGSRVERREDEHYPPAAKACNMMTADELAMNKDRCAGPAKLLPIINAAFAAGAMGMDPRANADRVEAALLWFLYISPFKEARTCTNAVADCDSSYAYYTGGEARSAGKGFARYVRTRSLQTHDAIWDGLLAVRCWRDLDNPTGAAMDLTLRDKAVNQLDRALTRGLAVIVRQRIQRRLCGSAWLTAQILGGVLDRDATLRDGTKATVLRAELAKADPKTVDEKALLAALDALFPCAW